VAPPSPPHHPLQDKTLLVPLSTAYPAKSRRRTSRCLFSRLKFTQTRRKPPAQRAGDRDFVPPTLPMR
jgi:hypothetical protein